MPADYFHSWRPEMVRGRVNNDQEVELRSATQCWFQQQLGWFETAPFLPGSLWGNLFQHTIEVVVRIVLQPGWRLACGCEKNNSKQKDSSHCHPDQEEAQPCQLGDTLLFVETMSRGLRKNAVAATTTVGCSALKPVAPASVTHTGESCWSCRTCLSPCRPTNH